MPPSLSHQAAAPEAAALSATETLQARAYVTGSN